MLITTSLGGDVKVIDFKAEKVIYHGGTKSRGKNRFSIWYISFFILIRACNVRLLPLIIKESTNNEMRKE